MLSETIRNAFRDARKPITAMVVSAALLTGIAVHEGYREESYIPVKTDQGSDIPTIGYGTTINKDGTPVKLGQTITREEAWKLLEAQTNDKYANVIKKCIKVPLHQYEFDAYVSLSYNIGVGKNGFCGSTLVKKLNAKDYAGACKEILRWDRFKGKPLKGLTNRRQIEYNKCMGTSK
jgi:lysozyme